MPCFALVPLLVLPTAALAETVHCSDAHDEVMVEFDVDHDADPSQVTRVQMQITDDFGISTDPSHEDHSGEHLAEQTIDGDYLEVYLRTTSGPPALILRLVEGDHGDVARRAGVLSVAGGGVWVVECQ